jgi:hypothetical protein
MKVTPPLEWVIYPLKAIFFFSFIFHLANFAFSLQMGRVRLI